MYKLRTILLIIVLISFLVVPYSLLEYFCYLGLCGGAAVSEIGKQYTSFFAYFSGIYLLILIITLIFSSSYYNEGRIGKSSLCLLIALLCLTPYLYVEYNVNNVYARFEKAEQDYYSPHPGDYICANGKFIREKNGIYDYFDSKAPGSSSITAYYGYDALKTGLQSQSINIRDCKDQNGEAIQFE